MERVPVFFTNQSRSLKLLNHVIRPLFSFFFFFSLEKKYLLSDINFETLLPSIISPTIYRLCRFLPQLRGQTSLSLSLSRVFPVLLVGRSFNLFPGQNRSTWSELLLQSKYWPDIPRLELVSNQPIFSSPSPSCQRDETPEADFTFVDKAATR